jgi:hypothetical protein
MKLVIRIANINAVSLALYLQVRNPIQRQNGVENQTALTLLLRLEVWREVQSH